MMLSIISSLSTELGNKSWFQWYKWYKLEHDWDLKCKIRIIEIRKKRELLSSLKFLMLIQIFWTSSKFAPAAMWKLSSNNSICDLSIGMNFSWRIRRIPRRPGPWFRKLVEAARLPWYDRNGSNSLSWAESPVKYGRYR